jgi:transcriptional regulator with XRE-family HTH domain
VASEVEHVSVGKVTPFKGKQSPGQSLRSWRENLGLTLRDVYRASVVIAARHRNVKLVMSPSRLSEIETKGLIPNIYRAYTLALTYNRDLRDILLLYGLDRSNLRDCLRQG